MLLDEKMAALDDRTGKAFLVSFYSVSGWPRRGKADGKTNPALVMSARDLWPLRNPSGVILFRRTARMWNSRWCGRRRPGDKIWYVIHPIALQRDLLRTNYLMYYYLYYYLRVFYTRMFGPLHLNRNPLCSRIGFIKFFESCHKRMYGW